MEQLSSIYIDKKLHLLHIDIDNKTYVVIGVVYVYDEPQFEIQEV